MNSYHKALILYHKIMRDSIRHDLDLENNEIYLHHAKKIEYHQKKFLTMTDK